MISLFRLIIVTIFSTAFVFFGGLAHAQDFPDVIAGKVINNSFMGSSVEGSKVSLYGKDLNHFLSVSYNNLYHHKYNNLLGLLMHPWDYKLKRIQLPLAE